jgi:hypothetical protein
MAAPTESIITIRVGGADISADAIYAETTFTSSAMAQPGTCSIGVRDPNDAYEFTEGSIIELLIDGVRRWQGYAFEIEKGYVHEADETYGRWSLAGVDLNILLDKLILYNRAYPRRYPDGGGAYKRKRVTENGQKYGWQVVVPRYTWDGAYIKNMLNDFDLDQVSPSIKFKGAGSRVENVGMINPDGPFTPPSAGTTIRGLMQDVSKRVDASLPGSTIWYIDPEAYLVYGPQDTEYAPFWVGDGDPTQYIGGVQGENVRSLSISRGISTIKNDVIIWAGDLDPSPNSRQQKLRYRHKINQSSVDTYGRFQHSEILSGRWTQTALNARANRIINQEGTPSGTVRFQTFRGGLYPGQIIWVWSSAHGVTENYPIRSVSMRFQQTDDAKTIVSYDVSCSFDTQDPFGLLMALKQPPGRGLTRPTFNVIDLRKNPGGTIPSPDRYDLIKEFPTSLGDRRYQTTYAYIRDSMTVYVGKKRRVSLEDPRAGTSGYLQTSPSDGKFKITEAVGGNETVYVEYHFKAEID